MGVLMRFLKAFTFGMERFWRYKIDHLIFWSATVGFHMFTRADLIAKAGFFEFFLEIVIRNGLLAMAIYTNLLVLIPRFIYRKRFFSYAFLLLVITFCYALTKNIHDVHLFGYVLNQPGRDSFFSNTFYNLSIALFYITFSVALQLSREWYGQRELIRKIEIEKLNTELAYLKAQINPHFLFNSINTIYFQIDKRNAMARDTLSTFSEMLRYQLYECNGHHVPIEREVQYLKNYIDLQRLRKDENYRISFNCENSIKGFSIAPLVLICLVENAFKHVSHNSGVNEITVTLEKNGANFLMTVFNTCDRKAPPAESSGIGLKNVRRRLELLYPGKHALRIEAGDSTFTAELTLTVNEYENELPDR
jgi:two-component system, LytTR family, sensor kinase